MPNHSAIGQLKKPLAGLVLHFGEGGAYSQPCEAAWVGIANRSAIKPPPVVVYVSKSSLNTMKNVYAPLGGQVTVKALRFSEEELDAQAFLSMMAIGQSDHVPLYMQTVLVSAFRDGDSGGAANLSRNSRFSESWASDTHIRTSRCSSNRKSRSSTLPNCRVLSSAWPYSSLSWLRRCQESLM